MAKDPVHTAHGTATSVNRSSLAKDTAHTAHCAGTPVKRSQVAKDNAQGPHQARAPVKKRQPATDTAHKNTLGAHTGEQTARGRGHCTHLRGTPNNKPHPMGWTHLGDPANPPGQQQGRYPSAAGPSRARLHWGPWQTSPGAVESTSER